jgi:hypothetical protein
MVVIHRKTEENIFKNDEENWTIMPYLFYMEILWEKRRFY